MAAVMPTLMQPRLFTIKDLSWETGLGDVFSWVLEPVNGGGLEYLPGQFNMLYHYGVGEVPVSISSDHESGQLIHTIRGVGQVTRAMSELRPGDGIGLRGPFGNSWPLEAAHGKDLVVIAGGIGLAPLKPVLYYCLNHPERFNNVSLLYGARTPLDILYRDEIEDWVFNDKMFIGVTVDRAPNHWKGDVGVVTQIFHRAEFDPANTVAFVCGPEIMMRFAQRALVSAGVAQQDIYVSMERNMKCATGHCGHCQYGPYFICRDGPIFDFATIGNLLEINSL